MDETKTQEENKEALFTTVQNICTQANSLHCKSIGMPAISVGKQGFSKELSA